MNTKMQKKLIEYSKDIFQEIDEERAQIAKKLGLMVEDVHFS